MKDRDKFATSIRFRLSVLYSSVVFGLGAVLIGAIYYLLRLNLSRVPMVTEERLFMLGSRPYRITNTEVDLLQYAEQLFTQRAINLLAEYSLAALAVLFLLSILVGWVIAGRALRPIASITEVARDIQASDLSRRIAYEGPRDELGTLADTFDEMLERLDMAFDAQRRFLADTSHDLRTPLAVIRSNVDVLLEDPSATPTDWVEVGGIVQRNSERMARMIDDLLAAARLEVRTAESVRVDLAALASEIVEELGATSARSDVLLTARPALAAVAGVPQSLRRAIVNLVTNAIAASEAGDTVVIGTGTLDGWAWAAVADSGSGIDPIDVERAGRRGLGLAIVRQVAEAHGGSLAAFARPGAGTTMTMWLPLVGSESPPPERAPL